ncbi:glyoxalase [Aggregicoccus sp. 17bor-14]|uniref:VOC family protein n=1 Tax=Myxococcaceae TaxID=31 RepID=UPI00129C78D0|nr:MULTISPECIES: VOC family protein [Myxococcaceae]MBF5043778.1 VOC family protein [Simulacricoccus sp. 17bor-14]MRI89532.1 glyoxalase [Aggregicoccus sp. 17bor-14]
MSTPSTPSTGSSSARRAASTGSSNAGPTASVAGVDLKLEAFVIPVSDFDRAKAFYTGLGWRLDADFSKGNARVLQLTPPGSPASFQFGTNLTSAAPGSAQNIFLVVSDIEAARNELIKRGAKVSEVFHFSEGPAPFGQKVNGPAPEHQSYGSYASFSDPDGNTWLLQEVTTRFPGRVDKSMMSFSSARDLASALRRAAAAHGEHEKRTGQRDENWPDWYAQYLTAEESGEQLPV